MPLSPLGFALIENIRLAGRNVIRLFDFARVVSSVEGREKASPTALVCQPPWSFPIQSFSITDTWSQQQLLKQLPNLIPKVTYLSHKNKMHI
ncbi:hypothetical protein S83_051726 [Arachis hypogaea]